MKAGDVILAGIAGTTAFTIFSFIVAEKSNKPYKQPKLIGKMIDRVSPELSKKEAAFTGWMIHYLIGIGFAAVYKQIFVTTSIKPGIKNGALIGAISGIPAALSWHAALEMHPAPPRKKSWDYYLELVAGHVIFGAACCWVLKKRS